MSIALTGLCFFDSLTQGGAALALGYSLSGFQPSDFEGSHLELVPESPIPVAGDVSRLKLTSVFISVREDSRPLLRGFGTSSIYLTSLVLGSSGSRRWLRSLPRGRSAQNFQRLHRRRIPIFEAQLLEDARGVNLDRVFSAAQDRRDVAVGFSLSDPQQHLGAQQVFAFLRRQPVVVAGEIVGGRHDDLDRKSVV